jgi:ABC-2 type transport system permease protein
LELIAVTVGVTLILSALYVYFRDVGQIWEVLALALFYATPILYPIQMVPDGNLPLVDSGYRTLMMCNPLAQIIEQTRRIIVDGTQGGLSDIMTGGWIIVPYVIALMTLIVGSALYYRVRLQVVERL